MQPRKRADWTVWVYKYWVRLQHSTWEQLPDRVRHEAEAMRALWNQLVEAFVRYQAAYRRFTSPVTGFGATPAFSHRPTQQVRVPAARAQRIGAAGLGSSFAQLRRRFLSEAHCLVADCPATWANKEFIFRQFLTAVSRFVKKQSGPPAPRRGVPGEVHFRHRFTDGGIPVARIFGRGQRVHLDPVSPTAYEATLSQRQRKRLARTSGVFQVGDIALSFQTILHRPLPRDAYLKAASLIGRQVVPAGYQKHCHGSSPTPARWVWSLHLTLEVPPQQVAVQREGKPVAVLRLACEQHGGYLQIGTLLDATERRERLFFPQKILRAWQHRRDLQRQGDQAVAETKERLRELAHTEALPPAARRAIAHVGAMRSVGLWRLLHVLEDAGATGAVVETLRHWADRYTRLHREARGLERRYLGHRDWFYHTLACQLCSRYRRIVVIGPPQQIGHREEPATYRHLAALSHFILFLHRAAAKTGTEVVVTSGVLP
ncbi:MAG: hypothetical protein NZ578_08695 [Candidatus Binatia bacterium]|nr:hypothetical protein [Candidatus Binatia bacterium]